MKHVIILGGDGYLGWPTAMYFSARGYKVTVVDNFFRRHVCDQINISMLYALPNLIERAKIWYEKTGYEIKVVIGDLSDPVLMRSLFNGEVKYSWAMDKISSGLPETVVHYAEQPSAPFSMMNYETANFTLTNNLLVTNNLMYAVRDYSKDTHIIKLGTMGEYGTPNIDIEEGWIEIEHKGRSEKFLFPRQASSMYHTSKIMDTDLLWLGARMWGLRVTDLMQGPVYGIETDESKVDDRLKTIFNYDELFGTIINRFSAQAVIGYPLTVYGKGGQTRGYINLKDTLQCVHLSEQKPAKKNELRIFNQIMETFSVNELALKIQKTAASLNLEVKIEHLPNPRKELEEHYYNPTYQGLIELGVIPNYLTEESIGSIIKTVIQHKENIRKDTIFNGLKW